MNKRVSSILIILGGLFLFLLVGRFVYQLTKGEQQALFFQEQGSESLSRKNYASSKVIVAQDSLGAQVLEQKYERTANLSAASSAFDEDVKKTMDLAKKLNAVVQNENAYGLSPSRVLSLSFGVTPEGFEPLSDGLKLIGKLGSVTIVKTDKTADFKVLEAKRLSLEKTRDGLRSLKVPGADLADLVSLETKILEIEGQIQELGVSLGDFDEVNSLCTVNFSLSETAKARIGIKAAGAFFDALGWAVPVFLGIVASAAFAFCAAFLLILLIDKIRSYAGKIPPP